MVSIHVFVVNLWTRLSIGKYGDCTQLTVLTLIAGKIFWNMVVVSLRCSSSPPKPAKTICNKLFLQYMCIHIPKQRSLELFTHSLPMENSYKGQQDLVVVSEILQYLNLMNKNEFWRSRLVLEDIELAWDMRIFLYATKWGNAILRAGQQHV